MSDLSIPGIPNRNSTINTEQIINDLLEIERVPLNRTEQKIAGDELRQQVWGELGRRIGALNDTANFLYSFQNPFNERKGISTNESAVQVTATRDADETAHEIEILALAGRDRFSSSAVARDTAIPSGTYRFSVGEEEVVLNWSGGSLNEFVRRLNDQSDGVLNARVVPHSTNENVVVFESLKSGEEYPLRFHDDALTWALENHVVEYRPRVAFEFPDTRTLPPAGEIKFNLQTAVNVVDEELILQYESRFLPEDTAAVSEPEELLRSGSATLEGITVHNFLSSNLLEEREFSPPPRVDDLTLLYAVGGSEEVALPDIPDSTDFVTSSVDLPQHTALLREVRVHNNNSHRTVQIQNVKIANRGDGNYHPLNPIEERSNVRVRFDGVEVTRASNTIDDLIPGVTLELLQVPNQPIDIEVTPDYEGVKESLISFVGTYNQLIRDINIFSRTDQQVIEEIDYFTDEERATARERLGVLSSEITLNQLRGRLITIAQNSYPTEAGREVNLLAQIGIATNAVGANIGSVSSSRLRGYLEIDESLLDSGLSTHFHAVQDLFGSDQNGDLVVDSGVAFEIEEYTDLYIQAGGVIQTRNAGLDSSIERSNAQVETYTRRLERYEDELRRDFGRMQGALNALDDQTRALENLNGNGQ